MPLIVQAKAQEELEKEQYKKFLGQFTAENFLKKVNIKVLFISNIKTNIQIQIDQIKGKTCEKNCDWMFSIFLNWFSLFIWISLFYI